MSNLISNEFVSSIKFSGLKNDKPIFNVLELHSFKKQCLSNLWGLTDNVLTPCTLIVDKI